MINFSAKTRQENIRTSHIQLLFQETNLIIYLYFIYKSYQSSFRKHTTEYSIIIFYSNANKNMHMLIKFNLHHEKLK